MSEDGPKKISLAEAVKQKLAQKKQEQAKSPPHSMIQALKC
ncbi:hypothetical protein P7H16_11615 [Paenibacillus larvae]|nr:hypothetical protein [Paenibacillus larvae]MDT2237209.1 hypothetical protein [Paenibacillus larvae]MDT2247445.1 hypothetical protein [Paenibacillus larvae]MDT2285365.1 hypothetical protein [Paenibacillus larvae]